MKRFRDAVPDTILAVVCAGATTVASSGTAVAAEAGGSTFPSRPIRFVVPFTPGALNDLLARLVGQQLGDVLGQQVIVDNRPGAGTIIGTDIVAKSTPDGHTLLLASAPLAINPGLYPKLPYDALRDLAGITHIGSVPFVIVAHPQFAGGTVKELVALARAKPGHVTFGATVAGQLMIELFKSVAGIDVLIVPYKGLAPAMTDVISGQIHLTLGTHSTLGPQIRAGRLRAVAVTSRARSKTAPEIPAISEAGYQDFDAVTWYGISVAARTPPAIVRRLNDAVVRILRRSDMEKRIAGEGVDIVAGTPAAFDELIRAETKKWAGVIRQSGIKAE
jgi:tripartite-type tricarboxylate transporter receptor subunit TctC